MKIIVLKGNHIISEFTHIIHYELSKYYDHVEYKEIYDPRDCNVIHFLISPQEDILPNRFILYNLEPMNFRIKKRNDYIEKIKKAEIVWEYSKINLPLIKKYNDNVIYQPFLYSSYMETLYNINHSIKKDIDVLFYGLMSPRRIKIMRDLKNNGINVYSPNYPDHNPVWLQDKFDLISRAKIVINIHYHSEKIDQTNDLLRIMFLLANKVLVVQEETCDEDIDSKLSDIIVPYNKIVTKCKELLLDNQNLQDKCYDLVKTKMCFNLNGSIPE